MLKIKNWGGLQRSDPFLVISTKPYGMNRYIRVYQTEVRYNTRHADWGDFILEMATCGGWDSDIFFEVWDYDSYNNNDFIGRSKTTLRELLAFKNIRPELKIINPRKKGNIGYWDSGVLHIDTLEPLNPPPNYVVPRTFTPINFNVPTGFDDEMSVLMTTVTSTVPLGTTTPLGVHPVTGASTHVVSPYGIQPQVHPTPYVTSQPTMNPYGAQTHIPTPYGSQAHLNTPYAQPQPYSTGQPYGTGQPPYGTQPQPYATHHQPQYQPPYGAQSQPQHPYGAQPNPYGVQPNPYGGGGGQNPYATGQPYASHNPYGPQPGY